MKRSEKMRAGTCDLDLPRKEAWREKVGGMRVEKLGVNW